METLALPKLAIIRKWTNLVTKLVQVSPYFALILALLAFDLAHAYPAVKDCNGVLASEARSDLEAKKARDSFLKTYLFSNVAFPQFRNGIHGAVLGYFLANEITYEEIVKRTNDDEFEVIYEAMLTVHRSHNVNAASIKDVDLLLQDISIQFPILIAQAIRFFAPQLAKGKHAKLSAKELMDMFYFDPKYKKSVENSKNYGATILKSFRSKEVVELSKNYRESIKFRRLDEEHREKYGFFAGHIHELLKDLMVGQLNAAHPELSVVQNRQTVGDWFWLAITEEHMSRGIHNFDYEGFSKVP